MISLDTETTGTDLFHGAMPFFVTTCQEDGTQRWWEWDVDPFTRRPEILQDDILEIYEITAGVHIGNELVLQNCKFDIKALSNIYEDFGLYWPWDRTQDTMIAGHLLASNARHDLTSMVKEWVGEDISPFEEGLEAATKEARKIAAKRFPDWRIAEGGLPEMPSQREGKSNPKKDQSKWRYDTWLPRTVAKELGWPQPEPDCEHEWVDLWGCSRCCGHRFWTVLSEYGNADSLFTLVLWKVQEREIKRRNLWNIYRTKMAVLPAICQIEENGISLSQERTELLEEQYLTSAAECRDCCVEAADGEIENLPVNGRSNDLDRVVFEKFGLHHPKRTKGGGDSMDVEVLEDWLLQAEKGSKVHAFLDNLLGYRKRKTALSFIEAYKRFWLDHSNPSFRVLYPHLNPTGTKHLRMSSSNPNGQQISRKAIAELGEKGHNARWMFGPASGREWYSLDGTNLELVIPAYEAGEPDLIWVFEHPGDPPHFGSYHSLIFELLHPEMFAHALKNGGLKHVFPEEYRRIKCGNFCRQYGGQRKKVDATFGVDGAFDLVSDRFPKIDELARSLVEYADDHGWVETIPDRTVDPDRGYPILCSRTERGNVKPTLPMSYHTSGTACWWMVKAQIRCHEQIVKWNRKELDAKMVLQVHDELVFDFPKSGNPTKGGFGTNREAVEQLRKLMQEGGNDIGVKTPVSVEWHPDNWEKGISL